MPFTARTPTATNTSNSSVALAAPTGLSNNDILIYAIYKENLDTVTWPAGFTGVAALAAADNSFGTYVAWKRASGESGSYTASWTNGTYIDAVLLAYAGAITSGSALDATTTTSANGSQANQITIPSITTVTAAALLVAIAMDFDVLTKTEPAGFTARVTQGTIKVADAEQASAGASGTKTYTTNGTAQTTGVMLALTPAGGAAATSLLLPGPRMPRAILAR